MAQYLRVADRLLPGVIEGFYVVGSTALGAYLPDHSDIDFVAVLGHRLDADELKKLRRVHRRMGVAAVARNLRLRRVLAGACNGVFVTADDLTRPVTSITPVASHVGHQFHVGEAFDVNPVVWKEFAEHGIAVRGPVPAQIGLQPEPEALRQWNLDNLNSYWRSWGERVAGGYHPRTVGSRWASAWGALGSPRLHHTITTGEVISKEAAGEYALDVFDPEWHPIIIEGLAYRRGQPATGGFPDRASLWRRTGEFVLEVVRHANEQPLDG